MENSGKRKKEKLKTNKTKKHHINIIGDFEIAEKTQNYKKSL